MERERQREGQKENRVIQYLRETRAELRKVVWPARNQVINETIVVVVTIVVMSVFFGLVDYAFMVIFKFLMVPR